MNKWGIKMVIKLDLHICLFIKCLLPWLGDTETKNLDQSWMFEFIQEKKYIKSILSRWLNFLFYFIFLQGMDLYIQP